LHAGADAQKRPQAKRYDALAGKLAKLYSFVYRCK
jgi:hypothetical protein